MSESVEMYLLRIALLQKGGQPVPISQLAEDLAISPVSTNQMCRKLEDRELVEYLPYKGVTLTQRGQARAECVLRRRRLWEVFLVEKLGLGMQEAEETACRLEHATSDELADRLSSLLGDPTLSPRREPIPPNPEASVRRPLRPLTVLTAGERGRVVNLVADEVVTDFMHAHGMSSGVVLEVLAVAADGSLLLKTGEGRISLSRPVADLIDVTPEPGMPSAGECPTAAS